MQKRNPADEDEGDPQGALLMSHGDEAEQEMICALDASLPPDAAEQLPPRLLISSESLSITLTFTACLLS